MEEQSEDDKKWQDMTSKQRANQHEHKLEEARKKRGKMTNNVPIAPKTKKCYTAEKLMSETGHYDPRCERCMVKAAQPGKSSSMTKLVCYSGKFNKVQQVERKRERDKKKRQDEEYARQQREQYDINLKGAKK